MTSQDRVGGTQVVDNDATPIFNSPSFPRKRESILPFGGIKMDSGFRAARGPGMTNKSRSSKS